MKPDIFRQFCRKILNEEIDKVEKTADEGADTFERVPEVTHGEDYDKIMPNPRDKMSKNDLLVDIINLIHGGPT